MTKKHFSIKVLKHPNNKKEIGIPVKERNLANRFSNNPTYISNGDGFIEILEK